jgi:tetraacyldisaccharide 4'-kinase
MNLLLKIWYHKHPLAYLLAPISGIYQLVLFLKKLAYQFKLKKISYFSTPIIVVGNLTVGGTGKTPLIIALANFLSAQGYKPGIVSRGYGGKPRALPLHVYPHTNPLEAGDEPVLIARHARCPLVVDPNRVRAVQALLTQHACDVILSDDGLQHTALGRDLEIITVDGQYRFGNGWCLPAGPLRESTTRLKQADFIVSKGNALAGEWSMRLIAGQPYPIKVQTQTSALPNTIHAIAGIGNPRAFFDQLRALGFSVIEHPFPDHYNYTAQDIDFGDDTVVIMTEKDAIKCEGFAKENHWCLPVVADCGSMFPQLLQRLKQITRRKNHA